MVSATRTTAKSTSRAGHVRFGPCASVAPLTGITFCRIPAGENSVARFELTTVKRSYDVSIASIRIPPRDAAGCAVRRPAHSRSALRIRLSIGAELPQHGLHFGVGGRVTIGPWSDSIDYSKVPELADIELESYRGAPREATRISIGENQSSGTVARPPHQLFLPGHCVAICSV